MAQIKIQGEKEPAFIDDEKARLLIQKLPGLSPDSMVELAPGLLVSKKDIRGIRLESEIVRRQKQFTNVEKADVLNKIATFTEVKVVNGRKLYGEEQYMISMGAMKIGEHGEFIVTNPHNYKTLTELIDEAKYGTSVK